MFWRWTVNVQAGQHRLLGHGKMLIRKKTTSPSVTAEFRGVRGSGRGEEEEEEQEPTLTFFMTLSKVSGRLMSKQMRTASESG